jgi:hypothetical protein
VVESEFKEKTTFKQRKIIARIECCVAPNRRKKLTKTEEKTTFLANQTTKQQ